MKTYNIAAVIIAFAGLIGVEIMKVYYIMPFPGSQVDETITLAYFLHNNIIYFRILGWILLLYGLFAIWENTGLSAKIILGILFSFYLFIFLLFNFYFVADRIFYQPTHKIFAPASASKVHQKKLVLGVFINGEAKAYPIEIIGYHHQVRDTVGGEPVMITYCTVCRTGRVFSPLIDGKLETFRLVGMDHYNAMFEDFSTKSWWRQVNGKAIIGPHKGKQLREIPSQQMSLRAWLQQHSNSEIMQPDSTFAQGYADLALYDEGTLPSALEKRDSRPWNDKSWIIGIQIDDHARAYDWIGLQSTQLIQDTLAGQSLLIALENDSVSFHTWRRDSLFFILKDNTLLDKNTQSTWSWKGECIGGPLKGSKLPVIQSYQEFWHSWKTFRPHTTQYQR